MDLQWRHPTVDDIPAWAELMRAVEAVDHTGEHFDEGDLTHEFADPTYDPANAWFGFDGTALVAFGWAIGQPDAIDVRRMHLWGSVRPDRRRRGLGGYLLAWLEARGRVVHAQLHGDSDGLLEINGPEHNTGLRALAERAGFEPFRYWIEMRRTVGGDLPAPEPPPGLDLRPYGADLDDGIRLAHNEAFADHWGSSALEPDDWRHKFVGRNFVPEASFAAVDGEEVAAYLISHHYAADAAAKGYREGWVHSLGTRRPWRGRGVGGALLAAALRAYADAEFEYASLGVDAANPTGALGIYQRLGFDTVQTSISYCKAI